MVVCGPAARSGGSLCHHHRGRAPHLHDQHDDGARDREPCQLGWCSQFHRSLLRFRYVCRPEYGRHLSYPLPRLDGGQRFRGKPLQHPRRNGGQIGRYDLLRLHALPSGPILALAAGRHDHEEDREDVSQVQQRIQRQHLQESVQPLLPLQKRRRHRQQDARRHRHQRGQENGRHLYHRHGTGPAGLPDACRLRARAPAELHHQVSYQQGTPRRGVLRETRQRRPRGI